ncbi:MAG TPA: neocarzinostatin apoprotein domain-containing protein [Acidimicrobiales bacterium]|nr:neocarzinostatin apoprotein domain-containing protein [Acidimicrobiales bacterium]
MSFVITAVSKLSADHQSPLSGRVDPRHVGVAGHSLGGITILGLATNTCCRDKRVAAAAAMAGDAVGFQGGTYTSAGTPPLLLLHGDHDQTVPYQASRDAFSSAAPPKFLVTLLGGDHIGQYLNSTGPAFAVVLHTSLDFFDAYLKGERAELDHVKTDGQVPGVAKAEQVLSGSAPPPTSSSTGIGGQSGPSSPSARSVTALPDTGLHDGQVVQVSWRGFTSGSSLNILECIKNATGPAGCDLAHATLFHPAGSSGAGSIAFTVHVGTIGNGRCDSSNSCLMVVNEGGTQGLTGTVAANVTFAA